MHIQRLVIASTLLATPLTAGRPAIALPGIGHTFFMRGDVVDITAGHIVICVGRVDGAEPGQILKVYRNLRPGGSAMARALTGTIRIDTIVNDHFASSSRLTGDVKVNDTVELERSVR